VTSVEISLKIEELDILSYLDLHGIAYQTAGRNVGVACVGVCCPVCGDSSYHCGVFLDRKNWSCWRCNAKGSLFDLMVAYSSMRWDEFLDSLGEVVVRYVSVEEAVKSKLEGPKILEFGGLIVETQAPPLPPSVSITEKLLSTSRLLSRFFEERPHLDLCSVAQKGGRFCCSGKYANRLILPVYNNSDVRVSFQARDLTGQAEAKYLAPSMALKSHLYGEPDVRRGMPWRLVIMEGILDAIAVYDHHEFRSATVATMGTQVTSEQKRLLVRLIRDLAGYKLNYAQAWFSEDSPHRTEGLEVYFAFDGDAFFKSLELAQEMKLLLPGNTTIAVFQLEEGDDPCSIGGDNLWEKPTILIN